MNGCSIRVGVAEHVIWSSFNIDVDQAPVAKQKFRHCYSVTATGNRVALGLASRCVGLRNRHHCNVLKARMTTGWTAL